MDTPAWLAKWRITDGWAEHRARGSLGGIDYGCPVGTAIFAPSSGRIDFRYLSDRSSVIRVKRGDGSATEFLHGHMAGAPRQVRAGELIGTTDGRKGTDGAGASTGPHVHVHDVTAGGVRVMPFSTITAAFASEGSTPIEEEEEMQLIQPLPTRVIRNKKTGDIVMLYPSGVAIIGDPLIPDIATASGQGFLAGQPKNAEGYYWFDLENDPFSWEISRHTSLLKALDDHIRAIAGTPVLDDAALAKIAAQVKAGPSAAEIAKAVLDGLAERTKA